MSCGDTHLCAPYMHVERHSPYREEQPYADERRWAPVGFYYVCVDFNPQGSAHARPPAMQRGPSEGESTVPPKQEPVSPRRARAPVAATSMSRRSSSYAAGSRGTATMSGFYYHQNSEP